MEPILAAMLLVVAAITDDMRGSKAGQVFCCSLAIVLAAIALIERMH